MDAACLKKLRRFAFATALIVITYELALLLLSAPARAEPSTPPLASYDWAVKASPNPKFLKRRRHLLRSGYSREPVVFIRFGIRGKRLEENQLGGVN